MTSEFYFGMSILEDKPTLDMRHIVENFVRTALGYPEDEPVPLTNFIVALTLACFALLYFILIP